MKYSKDQFKSNEAWLIFRLRNFITIAGKPADVYLLLDIGRDHLFGHLIFTDELPSLNEVDELFSNAFDLVQSWPDTLFIIEHDPGESLIRNVASKYGISVKKDSYLSFVDIISSVENSFSRFRGSSVIDEESYESALSLLPDSYDPCSCGSGKKYKFCCKPFFKEIVCAMNDAEDGKMMSALRWMDKAKNKAGETPEILCRYAIVYSFFDKDKADEYLARCLDLFPGHPRANYIKGIDLKNKGDYEGSIKAYKAAINNYPYSDRYHLNESWNNLGSAYYEIQNFAQAKRAWEKALDYMPNDKLARDNLKFMIYENPDVPDTLKKAPSLYLINPQGTNH